MFDVLHFIVYRIFIFMDFSIMFGKLRLSESAATIFYLVVILQNHSSLTTNDHILAKAWEIFLASRLFVHNRYEMLCDKNQLERLQKPIYCFYFLDTAPLFHH